jgi:hypothetical protein
LIRKGAKWGHSGASTQKAIDQGQAHVLANRLRRYFAPASIMPVPLASATRTGNRNVAISSNSSSNNQPDDSAMIRLNNGMAVWNFKTQFGKAPAIFATAVGIAADGNEHTPVAVAIGYRSGTATPTGAVIKTSYASDNRYVFVHAVAIP